MGIIKPMIPYILLVVILALAWYFFIRPSEAQSNNQQATTQASPSPSVSPQTSVQITDEKVGTGPAVQTGDKVEVLYTGTLADGTVFDSSAKHGNQPFTFTVGAGQVIKGWDQGLIGMKVGGKRKLVIPPDLAYGAQGQGPIPPNATLTFEIQLVKIDSTK